MTHSADGKQKHQKDILTQMLVMKLTYFKICIYLRDSKTMYWTFWNDSLVLESNTLELSIFSSSLL